MSMTENPFEMEEIDQTLWRDVYIYLCRINVYPSIVQVPGGQILLVYVLTKLFGKQVITNAFQEHNHNLFSGKNINISQR